MNAHKTKEMIILIAMIVLLFVYILFSGCTERTEEVEDNNLATTEYNRFIGSWKGTQEYMDHQNNISLICLSDGSFSSGNIIITSGWWDLQDNRFIMTSIEGVKSTYMYLFSENDTSLMLTCDTIDVRLILTKQMC